MLYGPFLICFLAAPALAASCVSVPTPEDANAARSQTSLYLGHVILTINQRTPLNGIDKTDTARIQPILEPLTYAWKNNTIPYIFGANGADGSPFPAVQKATVLAAMEYWQSVACVTFRPVDLVNDYEYLTLWATANNKGCYSNLGMVQEGSYITTISLQGCEEYAVAADMLAHTLGIYYTGDAITDKPSVSTIAAVNELYKCGASCTTKIACLNGGSPSGTDCAKCVCPAGWAGAKCDETSPGTQLIQVTDTRDVSVAMTGTFLSSEEKVIIVQAPAGKKLQATVKSFGPDCFTACTPTGLQIIGGSTDNTICSLASPSSPIISNGNTLTLRLYRTANYAVQSTISLSVV
ncbi:hypothetical protein PRIPAC_82747 [Pristionchus pacificus]|uniref:Metallopeptidase n=1 Tax=Pristionchus pacificus TaxID=54126 RepID=A0A2A6CNI6_PRIPA|nr:hypothetical protein PRIPAC_82747 [Pristionchus pacificus]|eukprot:PDM79591.1 metallopeptidase [Pristionchus pacificus]